MCCESSILITRLDHCERSAIRCAEALSLPKRVLLCSPVESSIRRCCDCLCRPCTREEGSKCVPLLQPRFLTIANDDCQGDQCSQGRKAGGRTTPRGHARNGDQWRFIYAGHSADLSKNAIAEGPAKPPFSPYEIETRVPLRCARDQKVPDNLDRRPLLFTGIAALETATDSGHHPKSSSERK